MGNNHIIKIIPKGEGLVDADPNPFPRKGGPEVRPGDTVTWETPPDREMRVVFEKFLDLPVNGKDLQDCEPSGPFEHLSVEKGRIVGKVRADLPQSPGKRRFLYTLLEEGTDLEWSSQRPDGAPSQRLGGGLDVPPKPPGG